MHPMDTSRQPSSQLETELMFASVHDNAGFCHPAPLRATSWLGDKKDSDGPNLI